jgi:hypothetical protein
VWLRAHCVDAATLEPLTASRYVYVELRTTDNLLVRRIKILQRGGVYAGYLPLHALIPALVLASGAAAGAWLVRRRAAAWQQAALDAQEQALQQRLTTR